jgi:hypothetical protein
LLLLSADGFLATRVKRRAGFDVLLGCRSTKLLGHFCGDLLPCVCRSDPEDVAGLKCRQSSRMSPLFRSSADRFLGRLDPAFLIARFDVAVGVAKLSGILSVICSQVYAVPILSVWPVLNAANQLSCSSISIPPPRYIGTRRLGRRHAKLCPHFLGNLFPGLGRPESERRDEDLMGFGPCAVGLFHVNSLFLARDDGGGRYVRKWSGTD